MAFSLLLTFVRPSRPCWFKVISRAYYGLSAPYFPSLSHTLPTLIDPRFSFSGTLATAAVVIVCMADDTSELQVEEYGVWFSPSPGAYAAIRINPVEMVRHLQDDKALRAASAMQTKTYLICLELVSCSLTRLARLMYSHCCL